MLGLFKNECYYFTGFRGVGFFIGLDIVEDRDSREPHPQLATKIINRYLFHVHYTCCQSSACFRMLLEHKILLSVDGLNKNVIKFKPPMCFSRDNAGVLVDCLEDVFMNL